jgi:alanine-synthesizing transaminase
MFSSRTRWDRKENRLARALAERRASGRAVVDLTETNPTRAGLARPEILGLLADPAGALYEPDPRGHLSARRAVAADFGRRGLDLDPEQVVLTASTSEAYALAFKLLCDPGDRVLVPRPSYPLFDFLAGLESVAVDPYPLLYDGSWRVDLDALGSAVAARTRAVVAVNPNNPTGSFLAVDEAERLLDLCANRGLALIADEVFADYAFGPDPRRVVAVDGGGQALAFSFGGLSKSCGLPQLKLGWIAVTGPVALRREALARLEIAADTYLSVATPIQHAAAAILSRRAELQAPIAARVGRNLEALRKACSGDTAATLLRTEGGWCAVIRVPATLDEEERACRLMERDGVLVHPGYFFDFEAGAHLVVSLLPQPDAFDAGVGAILAGL